MLNGKRSNCACISVFLRHDTPQIQKNMKCETGCRKFSPIKQNFCLPEVWFSVESLINGVGH